jgi:YVTN family beta-propeller protein
VDVTYRVARQPIPVGDRPGTSRLDLGVPPDLLLVADEGSNDLAVIRVRTSSLITLITVGNSPRDLTILLY